MRKKSIQNGKLSFFRDFFPFFLLLKRKITIFAFVYFKPTVMKNINLYFLLLLVLAVPILTSCEDDEEGVLPVAVRITADEFTARVDGKGWQYVESHEIRSNGKFTRHDYWEDMTSGAPEQYSFSGDTVTTYMYIDAYPMNAYKNTEYTFDEATNRIMADGTEVMRVLSVTDNELRIIRRQASTADGRQIYVYAVYRAMTPYELNTLKAGHPYDIDSLDRQYPMLPRQQRLNANDFTANAVGQTWKCAEAHAMDLPGRYDISEFYTNTARLKPIDYNITADSLTIITTDPTTGETARTTMPYVYRPNGFYIETPGTTAIKIVSLTNDEMRIYTERFDPDRQSKVRLYCVYRRVKAKEQAAAAPADSIMRPEATLTD